ncbi:MAG: hypothetical protein JO125_01900 [Chloroflexi bacterium]|nr:hypothetical protein [Ktedonobacteraceae bacterium]MBV9020779.1 hypothetical protein [Ktedonobacteraceae bacterium]MBV9706145.1 hypothetical protein [Chloroflexota bacterium]
MQWLREQKTPLQRVRHASNAFLRQTLSIPRTMAAPTENQRRTALTGFVLGICSLFTALFPPCGLPIAITGIIMSSSGYRVQALRKIAATGLVLSIVGLVLTIGSITFAVGMYLSHVLA